MEINDSGSILRCAIGRRVWPRRGHHPALALLAAAAAAVLLHPGTTRAADQAGTEAESGALQEVIVTAERRAERLIDVPISTAVLTGESLAVLGSSGQDIRQLAFAVPSLNIESSNGRTFPRFYIRGYGNTDFTTFASQPVGLYYDDIVQENPALKGFPIFDQQDVEVLRGPQGTLFGRNAPAGVVKIESAKPQLHQFTGYANLSYGTYDTSNIEAVLNLPAGEAWAFRASTQGQHRSNWVDAPDNAVPGNQHLEGYDDWAVRLQALLQPSDSFDALLNLHTRWLGGSARLFRANVMSEGSNALVPGFDPSKIYTDGYNGQSYTSIGANLHMTWTTPSFVYQSITGYESIRHYSTIGDIDGGHGFGPSIITGGFGVTPSGPGFIPFPVETGGFVHNYQLTQEFRMVSNASGPLQGQAGIFLFYEDTTGIGNDYVYNSLVVTDSTTSVQKNDAEAAFGSLEYAFNSAFKLRGGVRYTLDHKTFDVPSSSVKGLAVPQHNSASANKFNWDIAPTYQATPDMNLYARVATGFRAPSFGAPSAPSFGLPALGIQVARSEDNISYEIGIKTQSADRRYSVAFDVYYYDVSHQQLTAVGGQANQVKLINAQDTIGKGAELELHASPVNRLQLSLAASYNYTRIEDPTLAVGPCFNWNFAGQQACTEQNPLNANGFALVNGNPLPQAPKWTGDFSLRYGVPMGPNGELYLFSDVSYRSEMNFFVDKELEFTGPALFQLGARIGYTWNNSKYEVAAFCRNCTDQIRNIGGINFENFTGFINDPRIIGGQVMVRF